MQKQELLAGILDITHLLIRPQNFTLERSRTHPLHWKSAIQTLHRNHAATILSMNCFK